MVLNSEGSSEHVVYNIRKKETFFVRKKKYTGVDVKKGLKQVKLPIPVHTYPRCSKLDTKTLSNFLSILPI